MTAHRGGWVVAAPSAAHAFEVTIAGHAFKAFRHRTDYGWSWFTVTKDGKTVGTTGAEGLFAMDLWV
jgi:hypothetical protein